MTLASQKVLDAISTRMSGATLCGDRVFTSRAYPLAALPAWRVVTPDEDIAPAVVHPNPIQNHALQIELKGYVKATDDVDDAFHDLAAEALKRIFSITPPVDALAAIVPSKVQLSQRRIERAFEVEGQATLGRITVTLRAEYRTKANDPDTLV